MLATPPSPISRFAATAGVRQQRARQRQRDGLRIFRLECQHDQLVLALIESQRITERDALDHANVERAAAQVITEVRFRG
jgi:hypothetical protein